MDGPIDWWWKMNLLDVCVQAGFCQIRSHIAMYMYTLTYAALGDTLAVLDSGTCSVLYSIAK